MVSVTSTAVWTKLPREKTIVDITKFTCYSLSVRFFLLIRSKKILGAQEKFTFELPLLPTSSLSSWFCKAYVTNVLKKKSKNKKKTALYYYYYFHSINLAKIVSRHLVPKNDLGEISLKRKKRKEKKKEKGVFYQQVYVYERE